MPARKYFKCKDCSSGTIIHNGKEVACNLHKWIYSINEKRECANFIPMPKKEYSIPLKIISGLLIVCYLILIVYVGFSQILGRVISKIENSLFIAPIIEPIVMQLTPQTTVIDTRKIYKVAMYADTGVLNDQLWIFNNVLSKCPEMQVSKVSAQQIIKGELKNYDVLLVAGGFAMQESNTLGVEGREMIHDYVVGGGAYYGICAGAYLGLSGYPWSIGLVDAKQRSENWWRGKGKPLVELSDEGRNVFGEIEGPINIGYNNGPVYEGPALTVLVRFKQGISFTGNQSQINDMIGAPAISYAIVGSGRVILQSIHPEKMISLDWMIRNIIWVLAEKEPVDIFQKIVFIKNGDK